MKINKKIIIAGVSVGFLAGLHTAFWFYQSGKIKSSIEQAASQISKEIGNKNTEFFYTSSNITGFPFNFAVNINQPRFVSAGGGEKIELSSGDEKLVIISNLLGNAYKVKLPAKIDIKYNRDDKENNYKLEFANNAPEIDAKFSGSLLLSTKDVTEFLPYLEGRLESLHYSDSGYVVSNIDGDKKVASSDSSSVNIARKNDKTKIYSEYNINIQNMDNSYLWSLDADSQVPEAPASETADVTGQAPATALSQLGLWPLSANMNFSSSEMRDANGKTTNVSFAIKQADILSPSFGFGVNGEIKADGNDIFPFGNLSIKLINYQGVVDYFSGIVSKVLAESKIPLFHIKSEKTMNFKKVLYDIATEKSNEDKDISLTISREKGKNLFIGEKGLLEVIDLLKATANIGDSQSEDGISTELPGGEVEAPSTELHVLPNEIN